MIKVSYYIVTYDRLYDVVVNQLSSEERDNITCYNIQKKVPKNISCLVKNQINEWELTWNEYHYQTHQYYEQSAFSHRPGRHRDQGPSQQ